MLEAKNLVYEYPDGKQKLRILDGVSFEVEQGRSAALVGPSGSGKSTLLYLLAGIRTPVEGSITFKGCSLVQMSNNERSKVRAQNFGFVFQQHFLVRHLTVLENILVSCDHPTAASVDFAMSLLRDLALEGVERRFPNELSVGQRQRVALARALVHRPAVLFADEPTASLDRTSASKLMELLIGLRGATTLVMVTHDRSILDNFDDVWELNQGHLEPSHADQYRSISMG